MSRDKSPISSMWTTAQLDEFSKMEEQFFAIAVNAGYTDARAVEAFEHYDNMRMDGETNPDKVLDRLHNRITRLKDELRKHMAVPRP